MFYKDVLKWLVIKSWVVDPRGERHIGFAHGYHSGRGCQGKDACYHGNRLGCHGNRGHLRHVTKDGGYVTRDPRGPPWWLALVAQKPYIYIVLPSSYHAPWKKHAIFMHPFGEELGALHAILSQNQLFNPPNIPLFTPKNWLDPPSPLQTRPKKLSMYSEIRLDHPPPQRGRWTYARIKIGLKRKLEGNDDEKATRSCHFFKIFGGLAPRIPWNYHTFIILLGFKDKMSHKTANICEII